MILLRGQHTQQKIVGAQHRIGALVDDGRVAHFEMSLARIDGQHGGLKASGVAHLRVAIACGQRTRRDMARGAAREFAARHWIAAMIFRQHGTSDIHLAAADVGMQVNRTRHHDFAVQIDVASYALMGQRRCNDATITHEHVAYFAVDVMRRIVEFAAGEFEKHEKSVWDFVS